MLPGFTLIISLPGSTTFSGFTPSAERSAIAAHRRGARLHVAGLVLILFLSLSFLSFLSSAFADTGQGAGCVLFAAVVFAGVDVPALGCFAGAGISPPTGVVPGAGFASGVDAAGVDCALPAGVLAGVAAGALPGAAAGLVCWSVVPAAGALDCAHTPAVRASANPATTAAFKPMRSDARMTPPP